MDVPSMTAYPPGKVDTTATPGPVNPVSGPILLKDARKLSLSAPWGGFSTVPACAAPAGQVPWRPKALTAST